MKNLDELVEKIAIEQENLHPFSSESYDYKNDRKLIGFGIIDSENEGKTNEKQAKKKLRDKIKRRLIALSEIGIEGSYELISLLVRLFIRRAYITIEQALVIDNARKGYGVKEANAKMIENSFNENELSEVFAVIAEDIAHEDTKNFYLQMSDHWGDRSKKDPRK